jgi:PKD domain
LNRASAFPADAIDAIIQHSATLHQSRNTFDQFLQIIRTGMDSDHAHPTCVGPPNTKCIPAPFNGDLLQIMPWPTYQNMTDDDLRAIYTYLSAIPCLEGGPGEPANRCVAAVTITAVAGPKSATVLSREFRLDGTLSSSSDGTPLTYQWTIPQGSPSAAIYGANTATPSVQFSQRGAVYTFQLTVTGANGKTATDVATVNY